MSKLFRVARTYTTAFYYEVIAETQSEAKELVTRYLYDDSTPHVKALDVKHSDTETHVVAVREQ